MIDRFALRTLLIGLSGLVLVAGLVIFGTILRGEAQMRAMSDELLSRDVKVMDRAHALKLSVVQVQQWLTDISATRALDGLNDGFDEAAANAELFEQLLVELEELDPAKRDTYVAMRPVFESYYSAGRRMAQAYVDKGPVGGNPMMADFDAAAAAMGEKIDAFVEQTRQAVDRGRINTNEVLSGLGTTTWVGIGLFVIVLLGMGWVFRRVLSQVGHDPAELEHIARSIADGSLDLGDDHDEESATGVYAALLRMRGQLAQQIEEIRTQARENGRMRSALDNATSAITVSDADNQLIYLNVAAKALFNTLEPSIRRNFPDFSVADILGHSLGSYFSDPEVRQAYSNPLQKGRTFTTRMGEHSLTLAANPVHSNDGEYLGRITEWRDITERLHQEEEDARKVAEERRVAQENLRIRTALDNVSSGVMVADPERRIIYLNDAAQSLFEDIEEDIREQLPAFSAAQLLGASIDEFHRDPRHQASLLESLEGTFESELGIGDRTMRIVANPVIDASGARLGTAVEWSDRSDEISIENEIDHLVGAVRGGDLAQRIDELGKTGFHHRLATGFNALIGDLQNMIQDVAGSVRLLATGDLSGQIGNSYPGAFGELRDDVNTSLDKLNQIVSELIGFAGSINQGSEEISSGNDRLSARSEQQASSLQQTATSMNELNSTVSQNAANASSATSVASSARQAAEKGGTVVAEAVDAMQQINESSDRIAEIIGVIDEIAFQTNLLALNASVEAARAGEQGRGFAVVATEVRNLASRSAEAAKEIKNLIDDSANKVRTGTRLVNESGKVLQEIVGGVKKVGDIVSEIAAASSEQASGITQVDQAVAQLDELTQQNAALAEETSSASSTMRHEAHQMKERMDFFKLA